MFVSGIVLVPGIVFVSGTVPPPVLAFSMVRSIDTSFVPFISIALYASEQSMSLILKLVLLLLGIAFNLNLTCKTSPEGMSVNLSTINFLVLTSYIGFPQEFKLSIAIYSNIFSSYTNCPAAILIPVLPLIDVRLNLTVTVSPILYFVVESTCSNFIVPVGSTALLIFVTVTINNINTLTITILNTFLICFPPCINLYKLYMFIYNYASEIFNIFVTFCVFYYMDTIILKHLI